MVLSRSTCLPERFWPLICVDIEHLGVSCSVWYWNFTSTSFVGSEVGSWVGLPSYRCWHIPSHWCLGMLESGWMPFCYEPFFLQAPHAFPLLSKSTVLYGVGKGVGGCDSSVKMFNHPAHALNGEKGASSWRLRRSPYPKHQLGAASTRGESDSWRICFLSYFWKLGTNCQSIKQHQYTLMKISYVLRSLIKLNPGIKTAWRDPITVKIKKYKNKKKASQTRLTVKLFSCSRFAIILGPESEFGPVPPDRTRLSVSCFQSLC